MEPITLEKIENRLAEYEYLFTEIKTMDTATLTKNEQKFIQQYEMLQLHRQHALGQLNLDDLYQDDLHAYYTVIEGEPYIHVAYIGIEIYAAELANEKKPQ